MAFAWSSIDAQRLALVLFACAQLSSATAQSTLWRRASFARCWIKAVACSKSLLALAGVQGSISAVPIACICGSGHVKGSFATIRRTSFRFPRSLKPPPQPAAMGKKGKARDFADLPEYEEEEAGGAAKAAEPASAEADAEAATSKPAAAGKKGKAKKGAKKGKAAFDSDDDVVRGQLLHGATHLRKRLVHCQDPRLMTTALRCATRGAPPVRVGPGPGCSRCRRGFASSCKEGWQERREERCSLPFRCARRRRGW